MGSALIVLSTFVAAGVEWVEALTIVLAVGTFRSWRSAFQGTVLALVALVVLVVVFGAAITSHVSIGLARTLVGVFLLLFGLKWLHKAILRTAGIVALHDEAKAFEGAREELASSRDRWVGLTTAFNGVFLEGLEVVFIVIALGGLNSVPAAVSGALASLVVVVGAGIALRQPLTRVPENALKYSVGLMLTSFGTFFVGEGLGIRWPGDDASILLLLGVYGIAAAALDFLLLRPLPARVTDTRILRAAGAVLSEVWGLFVGDGALATVAVAVVLGVGVLVDRWAGGRGLAGFVLVAGVILAVVTGLAAPLKKRRPVPEPEPETSSALPG